VGFSVLCAMLGSKVRDSFHNSHKFSEKSKKARKHLPHAFAACSHGLPWVSLLHPVGMNWQIFFVICLTRLRQITKKICQH
jgi:hypothetical protein